MIDNKMTKVSSFHTVVKQATILRFFNRKAAEICGLKLLFCLCKMENIVQFGVERQTNWKEERKNML